MEGLITKLSLVVFIVVAAPFLSGVAIAILTRRKSIWFMVKYYAGKSFDSIMEILGFEDSGQVLLMEPRHRRPCPAPLPPTYLEHRSDDYRNARDRRRRSLISGLDSHREEMNKKVLKEDEKLLNQ